MENVSCSSIQRMVIKNAHFGDFNNLGTFNYDASIDSKCSSLTTCKVNNLCGGNRKCELTVSAGLLSPYCSADTSKELYTKYTCVDTYDFSITKAPNIRLSTTPIKGSIQIEAGSTWRRIDEKNWDENRQEMLCHDLGFVKTDNNSLRTSTFGSGLNIATGDLVCYDTQSSGTSCCLHLAPSKTTKRTTIPYVTCKVCDNPLDLPNKQKFSDAAFSGNGGEAKYNYARFNSAVWCSSTPKTSYLLIDLQKDYHITRIVTMGDQNQKKWSGSYSLKYSHNETLVDQSSAVQIIGNQNGYQASTTIIDIYNARYIKIQSTGIKAFCLRIELCGEVQKPASVTAIATPSATSIHLSWTIPGPQTSSYITQFILYLDRKQHEVSRDMHGNNVEISGLKPYTTYHAVILTQDGSSQRSKIKYTIFKTLEGVPSVSPTSVRFDVRSKNSLILSWNSINDTRLFNGELKGYEVCHSTKQNDKNPSCSTTTSLVSRVSHTISGLQPSTKYFVTVAAGTGAGYGQKSGEISKITIGEPVNPVAYSNSSLRLIIAKQSTYIKEVMIIVQIATIKPSSTEFISTSQLKPYTENMSLSYYVAAYFAVNDRRSTFVIGDGNEYNYRNTKYFKQPLKQNTSYNVFLRFFEMQISLYYSTQWSSSVRTMIKPPVISGPPTDVILKSRGKHLLEVSWKAPDESLTVTGYQVCFSNWKNTSECLVFNGSNVLAVTINNLRHSTKYFVTVSAVTTVGYGKKSLKVSKITNGEPVNPVSASYYSFSLNVPKPAEYIKAVLVIVQISKSNPIPTKDIETNELEPYQSNLQDPYVTAYLKAGALPFTFVIGDGKEYNSEDEKYFNQPLKEDSNYIVFLRFFENKWNKVIVKILSYHLAMKPVWIYLYHWSYFPFVFLFYLSCLYTIMPINVVATKITMNSRVIDLRRQERPNEVKYLIPLKNLPITTNL